MKTLHVLSRGILALAALALGGCIESESVYHLNPDGSGKVPVEELESVAPAPEDAVEIGEARSRVQKALAALPRDRRQIIVLRDYLDLSYAEIAKVLDIAPGTVMSRLHRSRLALKEILDNDDQQNEDD